MPTGVYDRKPASERFWEKVQKTAGCWFWTGAKNNSGYGFFRSNGKNVLVHRWAYEQANGLISEGVEVNHKCHNPACVNPECLELLTHGENMKKSRPALKTSCVNGHPFTEENTYLHHGRRECRECKRQALRRWRERHLRGAA